MSTGFAKGLFTVVAATTLVLFICWDAASGYSHHQQELVGTWSVKVQLNDCSGNLKGLPFHSLLTFEDGQTMIEDTMNPGFAPGQRGTGHGVWEYQGQRTYSAKSVAFINFPIDSVPPPPPPNFEAGTQTISQTIEFTDGPDQWTTNEAKIEFADTTGAVYRHACATASAERIE